MTKLLLVLVLIADPGLKGVGEALASRLADQAGDRVQVVVGPPAAEQLRARGVQDADLVAGPGIGAQLTARDANLAVVRLERLDRGQDGVIEARVWVDGRQETTVAIAGARDGRLGDPADGAVRAVGGILTPWLAAGPAAAGEGAAALARLAERRQWSAITAAVARLAKPEARDLYYLVLAEARQGRPEEAAAALARLRAAYPDHLLVDAAAGLVAPAPASSAGAAVNDPLPADDGGNVLR